MEPSARVKLNKLEWVSKNHCMCVCVCASSHFRQAYKCLYYDSDFILTCIPKTCLIKVPIMLKIIQPTTGAELYGSHDNWSAARRDER